MPPVNSNPSFANKQILTVSQWDALFSAKVDAQGGQLDSGSLTGTFSGSPIWSALHTFSGGAAISGGTLSGTFAGTPTYSGKHTFGAGGYFNTGAGTDIQVASQIGIGYTVGSGSDVAIFTPNGSNINLLPQGTGAVKIGSGIAPLLMGQIQQSPQWTTAGFSSSATSAFRQSMGLSGTLSLGSIQSVNQWVVNSDIMAVTGQTLFHSGIWYNYGGSPFSGNRGGLIINLQQAGAVSGSSGAGGIEGLHVGVVTTNSFGGTNSGPGAAGAVFAANLYTQITTGSANLQGTNGLEIDIEAWSGTTYQNALGLTVVSTSAHQQAGINKNNSGISITGQTGTIGLDAAYAVSSRALNANGTLFRTLFAPDLGTFSVAKGIDLRAATFSKFALASGVLAIDATGNIRIGAGLLKSTGTGASLDVSNAVCTGGSLTANVSATYASDGNPYFAEDPYGGLWQVTFANGTSSITGITLQTAGVVEGSAPSNPITLTPLDRLNMFGPGTITANLTWNTSNTTLGLNPSGGATNVGGALNITGNAQTTGTSTMAVGSGSNVWIGLNPAGTGGTALVNSHNGGLAVDTGSGGAVLNLGWTNNPYIRFNSTNMFVANGTTAVSLTSVGPSGAHATVQEWLQIADANNVVRYIPCF